MDRQQAVTQQPQYDGVVLQPLHSARSSTHSHGSNNMATNTASPARNANQRVRSRPPVANRGQPSIRLRRLASTTNVGSPSTNTTVTDFANVEPDHTGGGRRRSSSEPQRMQWNSLAPGDNNANNHNNHPYTPTNPNTNSNANAHSAGGRARGFSSPMPPLDEEAARGQLPYALDGDVPVEVARRPGLFNRASTVARSAMGINAMNNYNDRRRALQQSSFDDDYEDGLVDYLDVMDPEIATLSTLTNLQNSLFVPNLGSFLNRRPTYTMTREPTVIPEAESPNEAMQEESELDEQGVARPGFGRSVTITSELNEAEDHYAVLPHGIQLKGWTALEKQELNDHVRHLLHSRRAAFKRSMKGFGQYVRRPLGFFVTLYAFLITAFGLLWVLFLIGWISVGGKQDYVINIIDNVLVGLFAIMGDGLIPFRLVDTYHMAYIARYHHLTWKLRKKRNLPKLKDHNDLPGLEPGPDADIEANAADGKPADGDDYDDDDQQPVLTDEQQRKLKHHQDKFSKSHTFYKPHETATHYAFPLRLLVAIVVLLDFHSVFQVALGTCTWAISYHVRPFALTTVILCCSLACNITGGILISVGDKRTRKKDVVERMFRQKLTEQAMHEIEENRKKEQERNEALDATIRPAA